MGSELATVEPWDFVVGAGSVVTKDVEPFTVVVGNPALKIRSIEPEQAD